jgi:hypothetical protein
VGRVERDEPLYATRFPIPIAIRLKSARIWRASISSGAVALGCRPALELRQRQKERLFPVEIPRKTPVYEAKTGIFFSGKNA